MKIIIGEQEDGKKIIHDLEKQPVILMHGATGSGKSFLAHSLIKQLSRKYKPSEIKFLLVDCKIVEFFEYKKSPYLYSPVITCSDKDIKIFEKLIDDIEKRLTTKAKRPFIFVILDEFSDIACQNINLLEKLVETVSQNCPKSGVGLLLYTSRDSKEVITPKIGKLANLHIDLNS